MHHVVSLALQQFSGQRDRLQIHLGEDASVRCDADLLATAILTLVDNAIKYSPADEPVDLTTRRLPDGMLLIEVTDRGPGVAAGMRNAIFERYVRAREHARIPGTGIGLSLVKVVAGVHQGRVDVCDAATVGATFRLIVPLHNARAMSGFGS